MIKMTIKICIIDTPFFQAMSKKKSKKKNLKHSCQLALWSKIHTDNTTCYKKNAEEFSRTMQNIVKMSR